MTGAALAVAVVAYVAIPNGDSAAEAEHLRAATRSAELDLVTGAEDRLLHSLEAAIVLERGAALPGLPAGARFSLRLALADHNTEVTVTAPTNPRPFAELPTDPRLARALAIEPRRRSPPTIGAHPDPRRGGSVQTTVEQLGETSVKLTLTVEPQRIAVAMDAAAAALASQVKIPGFRQGRVPRKVLQARLGADALLEEALRTSLPGLYEEAVREADVPVIGSPEFEVETFEEGRDGVIHATVDVRPTFDLPAYEGLQVAHPEWEVTEEELGEQLDALRDRFAELETVERPVKAGDLVTVSITTKRATEVVEEASGEDLLYEVPRRGTEGPAGGQAAPDGGGSRLGELPTQPTDAELDRQLQGASAGAILKFSDVLGADFPDGLAGQEADFTVIVKQVQVKVLPDLDDDLALTASEFDTFEELRADIEGRLGRAKRYAAGQALRGKVAEAVTALVEVPLPPSLVSEETTYRLDRLAHEATHYGLSLEQYLQAAGRSLDDLKADAEEGARATVKSMLVLDAVGQAAGVAVEQPDLGEELARQAARLGRPVRELAEQMLQPGRINALAGDAYRRKTIDHLVAAVEVLAGPPAELLAADAAAALEKEGDREDLDDLDDDDDEDDDADDGDGDPAIVAPTE